MQRKGALSIMPADDGGVVALCFGGEIIASVEPAAALDLMARGTVDLHMSIFANPELAFAVYVFSFVSFNKRQLITGNCAVQVLSDSFRATTTDLLELTSEDIGFAIAANVGVHVGLCAEYHLLFAGRIVKRQLVVAGPTWSASRAKSTAVLAFGGREGGRLIAVVDAPYHDGPVVIATSPSCVTIESRKTKDTTAAFRASTVTSMSFQVGSNVCSVGIDCLIMADACA